MGSFPCELCWPPTYDGVKYNLVIRKYLCPACWEKVTQDKGSGVYTTAFILLVAGVAVTAALVGN